MDYVIPASLFFYYRGTVITRVSSAFTALVLYGLYVPLFIFSLYTLAHRNPPGRRVLLVTASVMFLLGTFGTVLDVALAGIALQMTDATVQGSLDSPRLLNLFNVLFVVENLQQAVNSAVADLLFLYRCYIIWGSNKKIVILPAIFILIPFVIYFAIIISILVPEAVQETVDPRIPFIMMTAGNLLLMSLTAGRIWYTRRAAEIVGCGSSCKRYIIAMAMILESGSLYCLFLILWVISQSFNISENLSASDSLLIYTGVTGGFIKQAMNIAPTLILVRVGMAHCRWKADHIHGGAMSQQAIARPPSHLSSLPRELK
ncbi:hypothetical protein MVEN_02608300 [Mycena venus]|uniref:Uncharacterized protein n=1 Tax=Mycena venus TaxID=2733690 RepID=A0A8H6WR65_9AGAR|nr:hypothetical protein MVEN_02608300 [Mycena venus]